MKKPVAAALLVASLALPAAVRAGNNPYVGCVSGSLRGCSSGQLFSFGNQLNFSSSGSLGGFFDFGGFKGGWGNGGGWTGVLNDSCYGNCYPTSAVPEPISMALLGTGLAGIGGARLLRRRRKAPLDNG